MPRPEVRGYRNGTGAIVIGLAAIVIGGVLFGRVKSFGAKLTSVVLGSVVYFCHPCRGT